MLLRKFRIAAAMLVLACMLIPSLAVYASQTPSGISFDDLESRIDAIMAEHVGITTPGAAVVIMHEGEIILSRGYGYADIERGIPVDPAATIFEHGSIGKVFVYVATMQLVERGLLDLDADIGTYLPEEIMSQLDFTYTVTMRDLLNHAAGFEEVLLGLFVDAQNMEQRRGTLEDVLLNLIPAQIFEPGTVSAYSNWGSALAALVVESISGQPFYEFEMQNILMPLGMTSTLNQPNWVGNHAFLQNKAVGYHADGAGGFREGIWAYIPLYPAGAINGTAEDLARFVTAFVSPYGEAGTLFDSANTLAIMLSPSSLDPINRPKTYHGLLRYSGAYTGLGHGGNTDTFSANMVFVPETRFSFVVLTNAGGETDVVYGITSLLMGARDMPQPTANLPHASAVEGSFAMSRRTESNVTGLFNFSILNVTAQDENSISITFGPFGALYFQQVEPYVFRSTSTDEADFLSIMVNEIRFRMEEGQPVQVHVGNGLDFTLLPEGRGLVAFVGGIAGMGIGALFFLIMPIILLISFFAGKKKGIVVEHTHFGLASNTFLLSGTLIVVNNLLFGLHMLIDFWRAATVAALVPHIWANIIIAGLAVVLFVASLLTLRGTKIRTRRKVMFITTSCIMGFMLLALWHWNFFALI
ncbi:MAG: beta-lactamase family protein [Defluviitaleaceae bacterium]|nr:beta-lactamase family protein [Defluviitaleaceae bacterium]